MSSRDWRHKNRNQKNWPSYQRGAALKAHVLHTLGDACLQCGFVFKSLSQAQVFHAPTELSLNAALRMSAERADMISRAAEARPEEFMVVCANCYYEHGTPAKSLATLRQQWKRRYYGQGNRGQQGAMEGKAARDLEGGQETPRGDHWRFVQ